MKRTTLKKLMMAMVIILLYLNNQTQGSDDYYSQKLADKELKKEKKLTFSLGVRNYVNQKKQESKSLSEILLTNNQEMNTNDEYIYMEQATTEKEVVVKKEDTMMISKFASSFQYYAFDQKFSGTFVDIGTNNKVPQQLNQNDYVLVELEHPCKDFIQTLLVFANITPKSLSEKGKDGYDDLQDFWEHDMIEQDIKEYIDSEARKLKPAESYTDDHSENIKELARLKREKKLWTNKGLSIIIKIFHRLFKVDVVVYDMKRTFTGKTYSKGDIAVINEKDRKDPIFIIENGIELYPVRKVKDLKEEFMNLFDDYEASIKFYPFIHYDIDIPITDKTAFGDYENLLTSIKHYNPATDYREKNPENKKKLREIKNMQLLPQISKDEDEENAENLIPSDLSTDEKNALAECFEMYIGENTGKNWHNLNNTTFNLIMENCRTYPAHEYPKKKTPETLIEFFYWKYHGVSIKHAKVLEQIKYHKTMIKYMAVGTLVIAVIPVCSAWKNEYISLNSNGEGEKEFNTYDMKLGLVPLFQFAMWGIYPLVYFQFENPFLQHEIKCLNEKEDSPKSSTYFKSTLMNRLSVRNLPEKVKQYLFFTWTREHIVDAFEWIEDRMVGKNFFELLFALLVVQTFGNSALNAMRDVVGTPIYGIIPPSMSMIYFIHKALVTAKTFVLVAFGQTYGFGMINITHVKSWNDFGKMSYIFFLHKIPVLILMLPEVIAAKLMKVSIIAAGYELQKVRKFKKGVVLFKKLFHTEYNNKEPVLKFLLHNWKPIVCKIILTLIPFALEKYWFHDAWLKDDCADVKGIFAFFVVMDIVAKPFRNIFHDQMMHQGQTTVVSENDENTSCINKVKKKAKIGFNYILSSYQHNISAIFWSIYSCLLFLFYIDVKNPENGLEYIFEAGLTGIGIWFYFIIFNLIVVWGIELYKAHIHNMNVLRWKSD